MQPKVRKILTFILVGALLVFAFLLNLHPWIRNNFPYSSQFIRMALHLGLLIFWGSSILKRIVHKRVHLMILLIYSLMLFWVIVKNMKYLSDGFLAVNRYFWYSYYIPWLTIPLLVLCVVLFSGKADSYRIPKPVYIIHAVTLFFILLVLTNDFHQLVFVFHSKPFTDRDYSYNFGFYALCVWGYGIAIFSFLWLLRKNRNPKLKKKLLVPIVPFLILFAYEICYVLGSPIVTKCFRDTTIMHCAVFVAILEGCIQIGLIASNRQYRELFEMCNIPLALRREGEELLTSGTGFPFSEENLKAALEAPVLTPDNQRITSKSIKGMQVFWADDMTEIKKLSAELQSINEELAEKNEVARFEYEEERKNLILKEKNRLYNIIQEETEDRLLQMEELLEKLRKEESFEAEREELLRIAALSVYIKRRNNLLFEMETGHSAHSDELKRALKESLNSMEDFGIEVSVGFMPDREMELSEITEIFNAYEEILEAICLSVERIRVAVSDYGEDINLSVLAESEVDYTALTLPGIAVEKEDERDYLFTYSIEKWA